MSKADRPVRVRIAPSPTGNAHVGTARNALYNLLFARQHGGVFILRIDDTDVRRSTQESEAGVYAALRWLGLDWDEGPDVGGAYGPYRQSERRHLYAAAAERLLQAGRAYRCFCTPEQLEADRQAALAEGRPPRYSGRCRHLSPAEAAARLEEGRPYALRFAIEPRLMAFEDLVQGRIEQDMGLLGDPVIVKTGGMPVYSFATAVDEMEMGISHVLRSAEHIANTFPQLQYLEALGAEPPAYGHVGLLLNPDRSKISKRTGAVYIGEFREQGYVAEAMVNHLALSGWNPGTDQEVFSFDELLQAFSIERLSGANAIFDRQKLLWLNGYWIRRLAPEELARRAWPMLVSAGLQEAETPAPEDLARLAALVALEQERIKTLAELPAAVGFFYDDPDVAAVVRLLQTNRHARRHGPDELAGAFSGLAERLESLAPEAWGTAGLETALEGYLATLGWGRAELYMPVRIAVSGREATPGLFDTLALIGREAVVRRLRALLPVLTGAAPTVQSEEGR